MSISGNEIDIAVSTRIRLARNVRSIPYPQKMSVQMAREMISKVWETVKKTPIGENAKLLEMENLSDMQKKSLIERHLISTQLASSRVPAAVIVTDDERVSIMINEEDHIRLQVFSAGLDAEGAYEYAKQIESDMAKEIEFDVDSEFGYLTSCPTNAGTGLRASVMLHLPAISLTKSVNPLIKWAANLGMTVRGLYGEGSKASGALFQLSNQITLGTGEKEIISRFTAAACSLLSEERRICAEIYEKTPSMIKDKCLRSLGILKYGYMISSNEAIELVSDVCMGKNTGIIRNINLAALREELFNTMPATLSKDYENLSPEERDVKRAQRLQTVLSKEE